MTPVSTTFIIFIITAFFCCIHCNDLVSRSEQLQVTYFGNGSSDFRIDFLRDNATTGVYLIWRYTGLSEIDNATEHNDANIPNKYDHKHAMTLNDATSTLIGAFGRAISQFEISSNFHLLTQSANVSVNISRSSNSVPHEIARDTTQPLNVDTTFESTNYLLLNDFTFPPLMEGQPPVSISKGGLKFNYAIKNWPFEAEAFLLKQTVTIEVYPPSALNITKDANGTIPFNSTVFTIVHPDGKQVWQLRLATECVIGTGADAGIENVLVYTTLSDQNVIDLSLFFPPSDYIYYDPDVQTLLSDNSGGTDTGGGEDDDDKNRALAIAMSVVVPCAALIVCGGLLVAAAFAVKRIIKRHRRNRMFSDYALFENEEMQEVNLRSLDEQTQSQ